MRKVRISDAVRSVEKIFLIIFYIIEKRPDRKGDGWCDDDNNFTECDYDGGDCCCGKKNYCKKCECLIQVNCLDNTTASSIISPM